MGVGPLADYPSSSWPLGLQCSTVFYVFFELFIVVLSCFVSFFLYFLVFSNCFLLISHFFLVTSHLGGPTPLYPLCRFRISGQKCSMLPTRDQELRKRTSDCFLDMSQKMLEISYKISRCFKKNCKTVPNNSRFFLGTCKSV